MAAVVYLDSSAVLRAVLESGTTPELEHQIADAEHLLTSRLSIVESARTLIRARHEARIAEGALAAAAQAIEAVWSRCDIWEMTRELCDQACHVAPGTGLRALDALHLATFLAARRKFESVELVTADERLRRAVGTYGG